MKVWIENWMFYFCCNMFFQLLLMVQKSQGQPPGMVLKPCKWWDFNYLYLNWCSPDFSHQQYQLKELLSHVLNMWKVVITSRSPKPNVLPLEDLDNTRTHTHTCEEISCHWCVSVSQLTHQRAMKCNILQIQVLIFFRTKKVAFRHLKASHWLSVRGTKIIQNP